jgi:hypothetical protein
VVPALPLQSISKGLNRLLSMKNTKTINFLDSNSQNQDPSQKSVNNELPSIPRINNSDIPLK